jgi:hypothetical protein
MQNNFSIDIILTYVDNTDEIWQKAISQYDTTINPKRYRQWNNLKYLFRGIDKYMSWINNVYLVVSNPEQVPDFINQENVKIILHKDIIPEEYLPTFNSTTIEMFLYKIPNLSEHFIYFNDDMFPMKNINQNEFFEEENGYPIYELIHRTHAHNIFRMQCRNSFRLAKSLTNKNYNNPNYYFYIKHSADPMLKSDCEELWQKAEDKLRWSISKFREPFNFTQYLFPDYSIMKGHWKEQHFDFRYFKMNEFGSIKNEFKNNIHKIICLNDSNGINNFECEIPENLISEDEIENFRFKTLRDLILHEFEIKFPNKCKYEK